MISQEIPDQVSETQVSEILPAGNCSPHRPVPLALRRQEWPVKSALRVYEQCVTKWNIPYKDPDF